MEPLWSPVVATRGAVAVGPPRLAVAPTSVQLQNLTVLCQLAPPQVERHEEAVSRPGDRDPFSQTEGVRGDLKQQPKVSL
jgi:hypothetical protein